MKAIAPITATVLIIAISLIAAVAIGGFVFGIFGTTSQSAAISVTSATLFISDFTGNQTYAVCSNNEAAWPSHITLSNQGLGAARITAVTITWAGANNDFKVLTDSSCTVTSTASTPNAILYLGFAHDKLTTQPIQGQIYSGVVFLSNGGQILFTGSFQ